MTLSHIPERDWKYLRSIQQELLNTFCQAANEKTITLLQEEGKTPHERWLNAIDHQYNSKRDAEDLFDDWRRSTMSLKMVILYRHGLLTDEEMQKLSPESQQFLETMLSYGNSLRRALIHK